jgi:outer membrane PBP1 activator LpoA protein
MLNACTTPGPVSVEKPIVIAEQPAEPETSQSSEFDLQYQMDRDPSERSLEEVIEMSRQMTAFQPDLALAILRSLETIHSGQLMAMIDDQTYDPEFTEWLDLALLTRNVLINRSSDQVAAQKWANYHYGHVITATGFSGLIYNYRSLFPVPEQVAILLPTDGGLASAARAIRDGIMSAYLEQPGNSVLRFYSSGNSSEAAIAAYLQAREDGATQIIGPLRSASAGALASLNDPSVPILLLNEPAEKRLAYSEQAIIVNSITLSQAAEALAVADGVLSAGKEKAIVIVPDNAWGTRIENAFTARFEQGGGQISATSRFKPTSEEYSDMLTELLKIDESKQRKTDLQARLGVSLNFEPNRRDDFDFIFMAASPKEGRELKPLLRFHDAGAIPVFSMGRIFSGKSEQAANQDLNGVVFPITPWQLDTAKSETPDLKSIRGGVYGNLYALGQDAWHVLPWLPLMQSDTDLRYPGEIGDLRMQANGHLERQPAWARFTNGKPLSFQWSNNH